MFISFAGSTFSAERAALVLSLTVRLVFSMAIIVDITIVVILVVAIEIVMAFIIAVIIVLIRLWSPSLFEFLVIPSTACM